MESEADKIPEPIQHIWETDMLGRMYEAQHLFRFIENKYNAEKHAPFVLNIDSGWGHGKTFFISHFAEQLRYHGYPVVVFDAWKNDFSDEALLSFISAICSSLDCELNLPSAKDEVNKLKDFASSLIKPALPILLSALVKQLTGMSASQLMEQGDNDTDDSNKESVEDIADISAKLTQLAATKALETYTEKKNATEGFTNTIRDLVSIVEKSSDTKQLPIFIFVDELDRCRPTFSIELLEGIKHLFSAPGVYFVVSTDTKQLCHSIKAVYGAGFDATRYLKRFFDMEYQLETPKTVQLTSYLFECFPIQNRFYIPSNFQNEHSIETLFADVCDYFMFGARDVEQIFEAIKTSSYLIEDGHELHLVYLLFIACLQHKYPENPMLVTHNIRKDSLSTFLSQEIQKGKLKELGPRYPDIKSGRMIKVSLVQLIMTYIDIASADLTDSDYTSRLSPLGSEIAKKLFKDNGFHNSGYGIGSPAIDKTLTKYFDLVKRAGRFQKD